MLTLDCYFVDKATGGKNRFFSCKQGIDDSVYSLLESVHGKLQRSKHDVDFDDLLLFKPENNLQTEPEETLLDRARSDLHGRSKDHALLVSHRLSTQFAGVLDMGSIQILVTTKRFLMMDDTVAQHTMMDDPAARLGDPAFGALDEPLRKRQRLESPITLKCIVVGEPARKIFNVRVDPDCDVEALQEKIKAKRNILFERNEANDLRLFEDLLPEAQLERGPAPKPHSELPLGKIPSICRHIPQDHVQLIVLDPTPNPYLVIYDALWHGKFPDGIQPFDPFTTSEYGTILDLSPLDHSFPQRLIRDSYREFREYTKELVVQEPAYVLLLGHPGIGKTFLLLVMLCWCFQEKIPVYYQPDDQVWFFNEEGCERLHRDQIDRHRSDRGKDVAYYLFDVEDKKTTHELPNLSNHLPTLVIVSSSPNRARYKALEKAKSMSLAKWWMEPWTLQELKAWVQYRGDELRGLQSLYAQFEGDKIQAIESVYEIFGGSARLCFATGASRADNKQTLDDQISDVCRTNTSFTFTEENRSASGRGSSLIFGRYPQQKGAVFDHSLHTINFISPYAASEIGRLAHKGTIEFLFQFFEYLCANNASRTFAGKSFERLAHRALPLLLQEAQLRSLKPSGRTTMVNIRTERSEDFCGQIPPNIYLVPIAPNFTGIDSLIFDGKILNLFQITMAVRHDVKSSFLDLIPQKYRAKMRLIFVMPVKEGEKMKKVQHVTGPENAVYTIPQFVLTLTAEQVEAAI